MRQKLQQNRLESRAFIAEWNYCQRQRLTGRIDTAKVAAILGFQEHDVPVLVLHGLLKPLGKPAPNARKYFAATEIYELAEDRDWLNKASRVLYQHRQTKNANRTK